MSTAARWSHRGDRYQVAVATWWVAALLSDRQIDSVRVDAVALPDEGELIQVDDVVIGYADGSWRFIQAKKNQTDHAAWRLKDAVLKAELVKARDQLEANHNARVEFCSRTPFGDLAKLVEDGADYPDHAAFAAHAPATLTGPLADLARILDRDGPAVFELLRRIDIGPHHDFDGWDDATRARLAAKVTDMETALDVIDRLVQRQQSGLKARGDALRRDDLLAALAERGVLPLPNGSVAEDAAAFAAASRIGRQWRRTIGGEPIPRTELQQLLALAGAPDTSSILLTDGPGTGKTCVLLDFADHVERDTDWRLLFIKGEVFAECATEADLAAAGLPTDLVARAARLAGQRRVVIVIDSLDVLSLHREHRSLRLLLALIERLERIPNLCVVTASRSFDLHYDPLLRERQWGATLVLEPLDYATVVQPLLARNGIDDSGFPEDLKTLLAVPDHLRLLVDAAAGGASAADFAALTSAYQLQSLYLEEVVRRDRLLGDPALTALQALATRMLRERTLRLPRAAVATDAVRLQRLISQGVLMEPAAPGSTQMVAFGHQTLLDALAVRAVLADGQTLAGFIQAHPPFPFLRPAVRGFALHLRATDPSAYRRQVRAAIADAGIAFHLKRLLVENLAELVPTDADWPLIRHLWRAQPDLFRRLLWQVRHLEWFRLLYQRWWPLLGDDARDDPVRADFILRLDRWMHDRPIEVVGLWQQAVGTPWGERLNLPQRIPLDLDGFRCWETPGIEKLLETLAPMPSEESDPRQWYDFLLTVLSRFVDATQRGIDLLWRRISRDLDLSASHQTWRGLRCAPDDFCRADFLPDQVARSERLLDLVLELVEAEGHREYAIYGMALGQFGLLSHTEWEKDHSEGDDRLVESIECLTQALSNALQKHARSATEWWLQNEPRLRQHPNLGIRYLLLRAYEEDLAGNIDGIAAQLLDKELQRSSYLSFELAELTNRAYPLLPPAVQDAHQALLLELCAPPDEHQNDIWCIKRGYQALLPIPAPYRTEATQRFLDRWRPCFGNARAPAECWSWSGGVRAPANAQQLLGLSDDGVRRLLRWFTDYDSDDARHRFEEHVGGREELGMQLADATAIAPDRFLNLATALVSDEQHSTFVGAILRGAATHLRHRFGHLTPPPQWQPVEPLPDGPALAERILAFAERYCAFWADERNAAHIIEGCADAVEGEDQAERLVWLLLRLARAKRPESERL